MSFNREPVSPINLSKVQVKTEHLAGGGGVGGSGHTTAMKKHTIDAILGLPRLACLPSDPSEEDGEFQFIAHPFDQISKRL